jgi:hypothetical protein
MLPPDVAVPVKQVAAFLYERHRRNEEDMMTTKADRRVLSRALAKAIAYHDCGQPEKAAAWVAELARLLNAKGILRPEYQERRGEPEG